MLPLWGIELYGNQEKKARKLVNSPLSYASCQNTPLELLITPFS